MPVRRTARSSDAEIEAHRRRRGDDPAGLAARVAGLGVPCEEISVGATPTARFSATLDGLTELRPGNYVYYDRMQVALGAADLGRLRPHRAGARRQPPGARTG